MTRKQKESKIKEMKSIVENNGFVLDRWGNYKKGKYRIKFKPINVRIEKSYKTERYGNKQWINLKSSPIVRIDLDKFRNIISKLGV